MGEIVTAFGVCYSPHLLTRPPEEQVAPKGEGHGYENN